jgi:Protein of unknown function (DUF3592)
VESRLEMTHLHTSAWEAVAALAVVASAAGAAIWFFRRRRPNAEELELARRSLLAQSGRLVDGMLQDVCEMETKDGRTLNMLVYSYRIGGVDYECSQDITTLRDVLDPSQVRPGFPCSVRYQPGNPQNSIVVAEGWSGLRASLPELPGTGESAPDVGSRQPSQRG